MASHVEIIDLTRITTQRDIAEAANLSIAAVSKALSDDPRMSVATKRRVQRISRELNYRPRRRSEERVLSSRRPVRAALVLVGVGRHAGLPYGDLTPLAACAERYQIKIELCAIEQSSVEDQVGRIRQHTGECDGVLIYGHASHELLDRLSHAGVGPQVMLGSVHGDPLRQDTRTVIVDADCAAMGQLATRTLLEAGRRRIGIYSAEGPRGMWNDRWLAGYRHAYAEAGLTPDPSLVRQISINSEDRRQVGVLAAQWMLSMSDPPESCIFPNEYAAGRFIATMREAGRNVAPDTIVVGGDYQRAHEYGLEKYPLIAQDLPAMIDAAVQLLRRGIDGSPMPPGRMAIPFRVHNLSIIRSGGSGELR